MVGGHAQEVVLGMHGEFVQMIQNVIIYVLLREVI